jgi:hypothetical protein
VLGEPAALEVPTALTKPTLRATMIMVIVRLRGRACERYREQQRSATLHPHTLVHGPHLSAVHFTL